MSNERAIKLREWMLGLIAAALTAVVTISVAWGAGASKAEALADRVTKLETQMHSVGDKLQRIAEDVAWLRAKAGGGQ